jgi:hypothetical protein
MRWITRAGLHVDRTACAWLIQRYIDPQPEFVFVSADTDPATLDGRAFDMRDAEYTHVGDQCSFQVMLERHGLTDDQALCHMGRIIRDADVPSRGRRQRESGGLDALMRGFQLSVADDHEKLRLTAPVYDALYAYCREKAAERPRSQATPRPRLSYRKRFVSHVEESTGEGGA